MNRIERRKLLHELSSRLGIAFGPLHWWPAESPFEVCVGAILTQNAPWNGVKKSIAGLRDSGLLDPHAIANTGSEIIATLIRPSIYYNQKAKRLRTFCEFLVGELDGSIENLQTRPLGDARSILLSLPGIGRETADSMLLYALGKPVFVVDAYTRRIFSRHGYVPTEGDYDELRCYFEDVLEPDPIFYNEFHAQLCRLGAELCRPKPLCDSCPARDVLGSLLQ